MTDKTGSLGAAIPTVPLLEGEDGEGSELIEVCVDEDDEDTPGDEVEKVLQLSTSFDSESDSDYYEVPTPTNATSPPGPKGDVPNERKMPSIQTEMVMGAIAPAGTFDGSDHEFEILPDDDFGGDDKNAASAKGVAGVSTGDEKLRTPPVSPKRSPVASPKTPTTPETPSRGLLGRISMPLSPRRQDRATARTPSQQEENGSSDPKDGKSKFRLFQGGAESAPKSPRPGAFRAIRALAVAAYKGTEPSGGADPSATTDEWENEAGSDASSSEDDFSDDDDSSSDDDSSIAEDGDSDQPVDLASLAPLPCSFLDLPPDIYDFLDPELVKSIDEQDVGALSSEHHLFVKGLLQLLAERDHVGVEGDIHDSSNILKMGPLKKKISRGLWSVKYVEIRKGNLTYSADNASGNENRKTIHLRKRTCRCEAAAKDANSNGFQFELMVEGRPKKLWMAKSDEERQGWIRSINNAMIGETEDAHDTRFDLKMYESAIEEYQSVKAVLQQALTKQEYLVAVDGLLYRHQSSSALRVPMKWIREQWMQEEEVKKKKDSAHARVQSTISDFWKYLSNTSVVVNGCLVDANEVYSAGRVIGALSRCILEFDQVNSNREAAYAAKSIKRSDNDGGLTELQATSYARSMLMGCLRSKNRGGIMKAVETLVRNDNLVQIELESSEPLHIDVSFAGDDFSDDEPQPYDISGWLLTRARKSSSWKQRFSVISEGVLSFFEKAEPRPHGLRGQVVLKNCKVTLVNDMCLQVEGEHQDGRMLRFDDRGTYLKWRSVLERAADVEGGAEPSEPTLPQAPPESMRRKRGSLVGNVKPLKVATEARVKVQKTAMKAMKGAKHAGIKSIKNARAGMKSISMARGKRRKPVGHEEELNNGRRRPTSDMLMASTRSIANEKNQKREPSVQVLVELNSVWKVISKEPSDEKGTLLVVRVKQYRAYLLSGGTNGRLASGDEVVEMEFAGTGDGGHEFFQAPTAL